MIPLSFLSPLTLFAAVGIPLLIFAYLRKQQTKRYLVSSVLVLKTLSRKAAPRKRFFPPLRFFLELLALCCLVLAAAQPLYDTRGDRIAVLFDNSLSMRAASEPSSQISRFERARKELKNLLARQSAASRYSLFVAAPRLQAVGSDDLFADALLRQVDALEASYAADALEGAAGELISSEKYDKLFIISDKKLESEKEVRGIEARSVGSPIANLAVAGLRIESAGLADAKEKLIAGISYSGEGSGNVAVKLNFVSPEGKSTAAQSTQVSIRTAGLSEATFELPDNRPGSGFWHVVVETGKGDALPDDNEAYIAAERQEQSGLLVVTTDPAKSTLGLERIPELAVSTTSPEEFSKISADDLRRFMLIVFHGTAPVRLPEQPALIVVPPLENPLVPGSSEVKSPRISSWASEHPITSYLRVPLLIPTASVIFRDNSSAKAVIRAEDGPILLAGEGRGTRFAALGFEIFPFEGAATPAPSVLTLNLLSWLRGGVELGGERRTGGSIPFNKEKETLARIIGGKGDTAAGISRGSVMQLSVPGGYVIRGPGEKLRLFGVNLFHAEESSTFLPQSVFLSAGINKEGSESARGIPLWSYLAWTAMAFIVLESLLALVRRQGEPA